MAAHTSLGNPTVAAFDRTWPDGSADLGLTREALSGALTILERDGRIVRHDGGLTLRKQPPFTEFAMKRIS